MSDAQKTKAPDGDLVELDHQQHGAWPKGYAIRRLVTHELRTHGRFVMFLVIPPAGAAYSFCDEVEVFRGPAALLQVALDKGLPLVIKGDGLDSLADLSEKATGMGLKDLVLDPGTRNLKDTFESMVAIRRGALNAKFKPFGFPTITIPAEETDDIFFEGASAGVYIAKYSDIVVVSSAEA